MSYTSEIVSDEWDRVLKGTTPIAWIGVRDKLPPEGAGGAFAPPMRVYVVYRYNERAHHKRGERVGEQTTRGRAFELAVQRCG